MILGFEWYLIIGALLALFMAWGIGANDVANAMGTSVGSGALTFRRAVIIAAVFEFAGAVLVGAHVTGTVKSGIIDPNLFVDDGLKFVYGMLAALLAAALWLLIATYYSLPVSTTHSIVGAVMGFGLVAIGPSAVDWDVVQSIVLAWLVSPVLGAIVAIVVFWIIKRTVLESKDPVGAARKGTPWFVFATVVIIAFSVLYKGLKNLNLNFNFVDAVIYTTIIGLLVSGIVFLLMARTKKGAIDPDVRAASPLSVRDRHLKVESIFGVLQIFTAISVAFAHGANDVANAIGPLAGIVAFAETGFVVSKAVVPIWILVLGGVGIVIGLATYGYRVIRTIGEKITELTPTRGYAAELGAAITILTFSRFGLPISTTHTLVGAVVGVGLMRGIPALDFKVVGRIFLSWAATLPIAAATAGIFYLGFLWFLG